VPYSASAGESGDTMTAKFRHANNMAGRKYNELFIYRSDLLREGLGEDDTVVLIDDFVGTGTQVCEAWNEQFGELLTAVGRVYLFVVAACTHGIKRIASEIDLEVVANHHLNATDNLFSSKCSHFTGAEKNALLKYCSKANPDEPKGKGDCGLVVVFAHSCPNNSLPVLSASVKNWEGLFRRYN
jgi:hypothetical protein